MSFEHNLPSTSTTTAPASASGSRAGEPLSNQQPGAPIRPFAINQSAAPVYPTNQSAAPLYPTNQSAAPLYQINQSTAPTYPVPGAAPHATYSSTYYGAPPQNHAYHVPHQPTLHHPLHGGGQYGMLYPPAAHYQPTTTQREDSHQNLRAGFSGLHSTHSATTEGTNPYTGGAGYSMNLPYPYALNRLPGAEAMAPLTAAPSLDTMQNLNAILRGHPYSHGVAGVQNPHPYVPHEVLRAYEQERQLVFLAIVSCARHLSDLKKRLTGIHDNILLLSGELPVMPTDFALADSIRHSQSLFERHIVAAAAYCVRLMSSLTHLREAVGGIYMRHGPSMMSVLNRFVANNPTIAFYVAAITEYINLMTMTGSSYTALGSVGPHLPPLPPQLPTAAMYPGHRYSLDNRDSAHFMIPGTEHLWLHNYLHYPYIIGTLGHPLPPQHQIPVTATVTSATAPHSVEPSRPTLPAEIHRPMPTRPLRPHAPVRGYENLAARDPNRTQDQYRPPATSQVSQEEYSQRENTQRRELLPPQTVRPSEHQPPPISRPSTAAMRMREEYNQQVSDRGRTTFHRTPRDTRAPPKPRPRPEGLPPPKKRPRTNYDT